MLSYLHAYHAGNHADVFKHGIISQIVKRLLLKRKPFSYLESHAGAGLYRLNGPEAEKTAEFTRGILPLLKRTDAPDPLVEYLDLCRAAFQNGGEYPGSCEIVRLLSRTEDHLTLFELHPSEFQKLKEAFGKENRIHLHHHDGFSGILAVSPPEPRRGFCLIDPSYETASDYEQSAKTLIKLNKKWPVGTLCLWYPLLTRKEAELSALREALRISGIAGILDTSLKIDDPSESGFGMYGSGLIIIRPPWKLEEDAAITGQWLAEVLGINGRGEHSQYWLTGE